MANLNICTLGVVRSYLTLTSKREWCLVATCAYLVQFDSQTICNCIIISRVEYFQHSNNIVMTFGYSASYIYMYSDAGGGGGGMCRVWKGGSDLAWGAHTRSFLGFLLGEVRWKDN